MFSGKPIPAIGVSIGIERVFAILEEKREASLRATESQVLVAQVGKGLAAERYRVLRELWAAGFKAETLYTENPKPNRQLEFALENGIPLVLFVGESEVAQGVVKIKSLNKKEEYVVTREELRDGTRIRAIIEDGNTVLLP